MSNSKNKSLQRDHLLPGGLVYTCYGCTLKQRNKQQCIHCSLTLMLLYMCMCVELTGEDTPTNWPNDSHHEDGDGHKSSHFVLVQRGEGKQRSWQMEHERGHHCPQKHTVPHLWNTQTASMKYRLCPVHACSAI